MATVTDYGLTFTEFAGVLLVLAFVRGVFLHARARLRPTPVVPRVRPPAGLIRNAAPSGKPAMPISAVVLETRSAHVEETADGARFAYWSLVRYRRDHNGSED